MKLAILTDTHFGSRSDSLAFDAHFRQFYEDTFFPYLDENGIRTLLHLGDVFDRRKYVNFQTLKSCRSYFFDQLRFRDIDMYVVPGNHDTFFRNTNSLNSLDLLLPEYENIKILHEPTVLQFDRASILMVPWLCPENYDDCVEAIRNTTAENCFGHFEISGFQMHRGVESEHGFDPKSFEKFTNVFSGHFHHKSSVGNIHYLGSPYQMTWSDYSDERGFHVFDTLTGQTAFVENPASMYDKIYYDDTQPQVIRPGDYTGKCVKLVVVNKTDFFKFDKLLDGLYAANLVELKVIEDFADFDSEALDEEQVDIEDTMTLLTDCVDTIDSDVDKDRLKSVLKTLYVEASNGEFGN